MKETYDIVYTTSRFKKKLKKSLLIISIFIVAALILYIIVTVVSAVINQVNNVALYYMYSVREPEKYNNYKIYDYHLDCIDVGRSSTTVHREDFDGTTKYNKIYYVSDDQFIRLSQAYFPFLGMTSSRYVLQNPDNYVDVFNEWTVERIDVIDEKDNVIGILTDQAVIEHFKEFINSEKTPQEITDPWSYFADDQVDVDYYNIRIYYKESENIYWSTSISHYASNVYGELIYVRQIDPETGESSKASISNYPEIHNWLSSCFTSLDAR